MDLINKHGLPRPSDSLIEALAINSLWRFPMFDTSKPHNFRKRPSRHMTEQTSAETIGIVVPCSGLETARAFYGQILEWGFSKDTGSSLSARGGNGMLLVTDLHFRGCSSPLPFLPLLGTQDYAGLRRRLQERGWLSRQHSYTAQDWQLRDHKLLFCILKDPFGNLMLLTELSPLAEVERIKANYPGQYSGSELRFPLRGRQLVEEEWRAGLGLSPVGGYREMHTSLTGTHRGQALGVIERSAWRFGVMPTIDAVQPGFVLEAMNLELEHAQISAKGGQVSPLQQEEDGLHWFSLQDPDGRQIIFWQQSLSLPDEDDLDEFTKTMLTDNARLRDKFSILLKINSPALQFVGPEFSDDDYDDLYEMCARFGPSLRRLDRYCILRDQSDVMRAFDIIFETVLETSPSWDRLNDYLVYDEHLPKLGVIYFIHDISPLRSSSPGSAENLLRLLQTAGERLKSYGYLMKTLVRDSARTTSDPENATA